MILGLSGIFGHDAAVAALSATGAVKLFEEERLVRVKRAQALLPVNSLSEARRFLDAAGAECSRVAFSWFSGNIEHSPFLRRLAAGNKLPLVDPEFFDHHLCHAAYAISHSELRRGGFVIVDGHAENKSVTIGSFDGDELRIIREIGIRASIGHFYEAVAKHLGFGYAGTGKLMGLASYSKTTDDRFGFARILKGRLDCGPTPVQNDFRAECRELLSEWAGLLDEFAPEVSQANYDEVIASGADNIYLMIAASAQNAVETVLAQLIRETMQAASTNDIVLGGGVAFNCAANAKVEIETGASIFVSPASGDSGAALGAAYLCAGSIPRNRHSPYLGGEWSDDHIADLLWRAKISFREVSNPGAMLLAWILQGEFVARCVGPSEVGPRALGNRSILARADSIEIRDRLNDLKSRERWRPFAPAIRYRVGDAAQTGIRPSPYMLKALPAPADPDGFRGAIHVDGSARIQTVTPEINIGLFDLLDEAANAGLKGLINTSFNDNLEPIVYSPRDAIRTFFSTGLSCMQLGNTIVVRK